MILDVVGNGKSTFMSVFDLIAELMDTGWIYIGMCKGGSSFFGGRKHDVVRLLLLFVEQAD